MNRPLLVAIAGVLVVIAAIVLNFSLEDPNDADTGSAPATVDASGPETGATDPVEPENTPPSFDVVRIDPQGKGFAQMLLDIEIPVPADLAARDGLNAAARN